MAVRDTPLINAVRNGLEYLGFGRWIAPFPIRREARPWTRNEIDVAPGLDVSPPDYVGIGAQKSGTSWWASLIEQHPEVHPNYFGRKEMHYLSHFLENPLSRKDIETYHLAFARPAGKKCGEWTPNYMPNPHSILRLREAAPDAKVLVMLRNPIDRFESGFNHERKQRFGGTIGPRIRMEVIREYALRTESIWNGMYAAQLDLVFRILAKEQVLVLQYERCTLDPREMIRRTWRFLGIDESFQPDGIERKVNEQRRVLPGLAEEARRVLRQVYAPDVERLKKQCPEDIDLSLWDGFET